MGSKNVESEDNQEKVFNNICDRRDSKDTEVYEGRSGEGGLFIQILPILVFCRTDVQILLLNFRYGSNAMRRK